MENNKISNYNQNFIREIGLINENEYNKLKNSHIIICGLGGVGSYTFEMLVRTGIENFTIIDFDKFEESNINRQLESFSTNIGEYKTNIYKERALNINPKVNINNINIKLTAENIKEIIDINNKYDFIIDCIDDTKTKIALSIFAKKYNINIISCMGSANHIKTNNIKISMLSKTRYCPLAKIMRNELFNKKNIDIMTLYIDEEQESLKNNINRISSISYVVATCGIKLAEYVIAKIISN